VADTYFKEVHLDLNSLTKFIEIGDIGLPDIQRPFVWKNAKVRDLFDSMYHGYPVGYLLFWQNAYADDSRGIGVETKQKTPKLLIVDGQQRLTSLYAVVKGIPVVREGYRQEKIEIAFNPLLEKFEVADAAIRKDKAFIPNISVVWAKDTDIFEVADEYLERLSESRELTSEDRKKIRKSIARLTNLTTFPFTALELSSEIDEEQVADVFVRINSKGTPLNQADFILTLMSVFRDQERAKLEAFCQAARQPTTGEPSPFNHYIQPDPDQLLRVAVGLGFKRGRLKNVYSILRGKDLETEEFSPERREEQFGVLEGAQQHALNLTYWHDFFKAIRLAGYAGGRLISSKNNLLYTYLFYLLGRTEYGVDEHRLRRSIARWFFMSSLTGRYTGSPESAVEFDLARFRSVNSADEFARVLDTTCNATLTGDFWSITLPNDLATSAAVSPSLFSYYAALVLQDAQALFSDQKIVDLLDPSVHGTKSPAERHHLFPKAHLKSLEITEYRDVNQIANFALTEWGDNIRIGAQSPAEYLPELAARFGPEDLRRMSYWHALPDGWEGMEYQEFVGRRRELIAKVIRDGFESLRASEDVASQDEEIPLEQLIGGGETITVELKATLRTNLHTNDFDKRMELAILKTIAGFVNQRGGTLFVGVADDGSPVGLEPDRFPSEDKMHLHLVNLLRDRIGPQHMMYIHPHFEDLNSHRILVVQCTAARSPVFVRDGNAEKFYVRTGAATTELSASQTHEFIKQRFE